MIIRIVQMTFQENRVDDFLKFAREIRYRIRDFPGCEHLDILRDTNKRNIFFSYSIWESADDLECYRNSDFFRVTWSRVREWFSEKPRAWSVEKI